MHSIRSLRLAVLAGALSLSLASASLAAPNPPVSGPAPNQDIGAVITNTLKTPATVTGTPSVNNTGWRGVTCTFAATASSGSGSETWSIEGFDAATNVWYPIATTSALNFGPGTVSLAQGTLTVSPGVATSSLSSGNTAQNAHLPLKWRLKDVIAGSGLPGVTSKAGCNYLN